MFHGRTPNIPPAPDNMEFYSNRARKKLALALVGVAVLVVAVVALSGCSNKATQYWNDSPRSSTVNDKPADIISFPDGFSNVSTKCDHGNRLYVIFHNDGKYGSVAVVANDPSCTGK